MPWVEDGIEESEREATRALVQLATFGQDAFILIAAADWTEDGLNSDEVSVANRLAYISERSSELALQIASFPWLADNVDEDEESIVTALSYATQNDPTLSKRIAAFPWLAEGVDALEALVVSALAYSTEHSSEMAHVVASLPWMADGVDESEASIVRNLRLITQNHSSEALQIAKMPLLERLESADLAAIESLGDLSYFRPSSFTRVMEHPTISAGITNDWAKIVATLYGVDTSNPQLVDTLLDPKLVTVDIRTIQLPLAGQVELAIIRLEPGAARSMDLLEHAVRSAEAFMDVPLPTGYVALLFANAVSGTSAGTNFGTHVAVRPEYDVDDDSHEAESAASIIAHEVGHYYWSGNLAWIDEGASELIAAFSEHSRVARPLEPDNAPCGHAENLARLVRLGAADEEKSHPAFGCNYSLGERLFLDLYRSLGDRAFQQGFRNLYKASEVEDEDETTKGMAVGISELRKAFGNSTSAPTITARWYEGTESYDRSRLDKSPVGPALPSINGSIDPVKVALSEEDCYASRYELNFSASEVIDWVYICLHYSYSLATGAGSVEVPLEYAVYYQDGFAFDRRELAITAESVYIGGSWSVATGPQPPDPWATGRYYIYVYHEGIKVGETQFTVLR